MVPSLLVDVARLIADDVWLKGQDAVELDGLVERVSQLVDLGPGQTVFVAWCGGGAIPSLLAGRGATVGGIDPDAEAVARSARAVPAGLFRCADPVAIDPAEPWGIVLAVGAFSRVTDEDARRGLLARLTAMAAHAVVLLDIGPEPGISPGWLLRAVAETGSHGAQFVHDDDPSGRTRTHVVAAIGH